jgi:Lipocalin-like domain
MTVYRKPIVWVLIALVPLLCASCLSMTMSKGVNVDPGAPSSGTVETALDKNLVDTWELLYELNDKGEQKRVPEATRTLMEFTGKGQVIFNKIDKEHPDKLRTQTGKYSLHNQKIKLTDDAGHTVKWPYTVNGDTLVIAMPEKNMKFFWRRFR